MISWPEAFTAVGITSGIAAAVWAVAWAQAKSDIARYEWLSMTNPVEPDPRPLWSYTGPMPETTKTAAPTKGAAVETSKGDGEVSASWDDHPPR